MDAELIEKVARAMHEDETERFPWSAEFDWAQNQWRDRARAAITALSAQAEPVAW